MFLVRAHFNRKEKKTAMYYGTYLFTDVKIYSNEYREAFKILDYGLLN